VKSSKRTFLKKYIVSIYREKRNHPRSIVGIVEEVGVDGKKAFHNYDELWEILNPNKDLQRLFEEKRESWE
jgi:hypothetical protein